MPVDGYSTHQEALAWAVLRTTGPVVELGAGWYSTPLLHGLCEAMGRELFTVEADQTWLDEFTSWGREWWHHLIHDPQMIQRNISPGVVFVDHDQRNPTRANSIREALMSNAQIVVVHDTHPDMTQWPGSEGMQDALAEAKYRRDWFEFRQGTTAVSNTVPL